MAVKADYLNFILFWTLKMMSDCNGIMRIILMFFINLQYNGVSMLQ